MHFSIVLFNPGSVTVTASEVELRHGLSHLSSPVVVFQHLVQVLFCSESLSVKISYGCQRFRSILIRGEFVIMKRFVVVLFHTVAQLIHFTQFILRGSHALISAGQKQFFRLSRVLRHACPLQVTEGKIVFCRNVPLIGGQLKVFHRFFLIPLNTQACAVAGTAVS